MPRKEQPTFRDKKCESDLKRFRNMDSIAVFLIHANSIGTAASAFVALKEMIREHGTTHNVERILSRIQKHHNELTDQMRELLSMWPIKKD